MVGSSVVSPVTNINEIETLRPFDCDCKSPENRGGHPVDHVLAHSNLIEDAGLIEIPCRQMR